MVDVDLYECPFDCGRSSWRSITFMPPSGRQVGSWPEYPLYLPTRLLWAILWALKCDRRSNVWKGEPQIYFEDMVESEPWLSTGGGSVKSRFMLKAPERLSCAKNHGPKEHLTSLVT